VLVTVRNIGACCVRQLRWIFPVADAAADRWFFRAWSFSQRQKNIAGVGHSAFVSASFF